jgi:hypothetical protein
MIDYPHVDACGRPASIGEMDVLESFQYFLLLRFTTYYSLFLLLGLKFEIEIAIAIGIE